MLGGSGGGQRKDKVVRQWVLSLRRNEGMNEVLLGVVVSTVKEEYEKQRKERKKRKRKREKKKKERKKGFTCLHQRSVVLCPPMAHYPPVQIPCALTK